MDERLRDILCNVFGVFPGEVHDELSIDDVAGWDSLTHLTLLLTLEQGFGVSFEPEEAAGLTSVRAIRRALGRKMAAAPQQG